MSYFIIKALLEGYDDVDSLYSFVSQNVSTVSREIGGIDSMQDPTSLGNMDLRF